MKASMDPSTYIPGRSNLFTIAQIIKEAGEISAAKKKRMEEF